MNGELAAHVSAGVSKGVFPGAAWAVGGIDWVQSGCAGRFTYDLASPEVTPATYFDLASLTKVMATTSVAMLLAAKGELDVGQPVQHYLPRFAGEGKPAVKVTHLLRHCAGFRATMPLWQICRDKSEAKERILAAPLEYEPETASVYSCLGFLLLQQVLLTILGDEKSYARYLDREVMRPLGISKTGFCPTDPCACAPTEGELQGRVHDENARFLGGISGNAGLFGTCTDVARFGQAMLLGGEGVLPEALMRAWTIRQTDLSSRAMGYDTNAEPCSAGKLMTKSAFGHTGFTGTTLWIDPELGLFFVLLTNRVHPTRENMLITDYRRQFHDEAVRLYRR